MFSQQFKRAVVSSAQNYAQQSSIHLPARISSTSQSSLHQSRSFFTTSINQIPNTLYKSSNRHTPSKISLQSLSSSTYFRSFSHVAPLFAITVLQHSAKPFIPHSTQTPISPSQAKHLTRDLDINYFANEEHYKEDVTYMHTQDIVVNIRQVQRIIMKDTFLCKKYARFMIETIEDAKRIIEQAEKRLGTMIEVTTHEPTNEIYREYILKLDAERDALDGYLNLALLCVMPVANISKHLGRPLDEEQNDGGLPAEFELVQEQFDVTHEQLNQLRELAMKCDGLVEVTDLCVQDFYQSMVKEIEDLQDNRLPSRLEYLSGQQQLGQTFFDPVTLKSTNKWVPDRELERVFNTISDPDLRNIEIRRIARSNELKSSKMELDNAIAKHNGEDDDDDYDDYDDYD